MSAYYDFERVEKYINKRIPRATGQSVYVVALDKTNKTFNTLEEARKYVSDKTLENYYKRIQEQSPTELETPELLMRIFNFEDGYKIDNEKIVDASSIEEHIEENFKWVISTYLSEREEKLLTERIINKKTLEATALILGVTKERVRQIEAKALRRLKLRRNYLALGKNIGDLFITIKEEEQKLQNKLFAINKQIERLVNNDFTKEEIFDLVTKKDTNCSIMELDLSVRSYNCLKRAGINTIEELMKVEDEQLLRLRNMGKKSFKEIKDKLKVFLTINNNDND